MKNILSNIVTFVILASFALQGCAPAAAPAPAAEAPAAEAPAAEAPAAEAPAAATTVPAAADSKISIAYIVKLGDQPWFVQETKGVKDKAEELGMDVIVQDVQSSAESALSAVDTVIGAGVKGIIIVVPDQQIGPAVMERAEKAGIPVIAVDDSIKDAAGNAVPFAGADWAKIGGQVGDVAADLYLKSGWADNPQAVVKIASVEQRSLTVCNDRYDNSAKNFFSKVSNLTSEDIIAVPYDNSLNDALDKMATTITANPDVTNWIIWSCNDDGVVGAWRALENAGVSADNVIGVGLGGAYACAEYQKDIPSGMKATIYSDSAVHGATAVQTLYDFIVNGKPIPAMSEAEPKVVDESNYLDVVVGCK